MGGWQKGNIMKREALITWNEPEKKWELFLSHDNEEWQFSKSWGIIKMGEDELTGCSIDFVNDSIICEVAHLQYLGYSVKVSI